MRGGKKRRSGQLEPGPKPGPPAFPGRAEGGSGRLTAHMGQDYATHRRQVGTKACQLRTAGSEGGHRATAPLSPR